MKAQTHDSVPRYAWLAPASTDPTVPAMRITTSAGTLDLTSSEFEALAELLHSDFVSRRDELTTVHLREHRRRPRRFRLVLAALACALVPSLAACGGGPSMEAAPSSSLTPIQQCDEQGAVAAYVAAEDSQSRLRAIKRLVREADCSMLVNDRYHACIPSDHAFGEASKPPPYRVWREPRAHFIRAMIKIRKGDRFPTSLPDGDSDNFAKVSEMCVSLGDPDRPALIVGTVR